MRGKNLPLVCHWGHCVAVPLGTLETMWNVPHSHPYEEKGSLRVTPRALSPPLFTVVSVEG